MSYKKEIELQRIEKNNFFRSSHHSPLTHKQRPNFVALEYFPISEDHVFELKMSVFDNQEIVTMQTSDNQVRDYFKYGYLEFDINNESGRLHVYRDSHNPDYYFVPFKDATSGPVTYGAGRYVEIEQLKEGKFRLDFNIAYNPYCAYNIDYSCPIPPSENILKIPIEAGEKNFPDAEY